MLKKIIRFFSKPVLYILKIYWKIFKPKKSGTKIILTYQGKTLLVKHTYGNKFTFPGGNLKKGEDKEAGIRREVKEELGIALNNIFYLGSFVSTLYYKENTIHVYKAELAALEYTLDQFEIDEVRLVPIEQLPTFLSHSALEIFALYK